jgi:FAD/FMN-containing dehydrogenase
MTIAVHSTDTHSFELADIQFDALAARLAGKLITPDSPDYDAARSVLYVNVDRRPLVIVRAADAEDVAEAVSFARALGLPLAVRSGGHSLAHLSVIDDAVVIDLSAMNRVVIDPATRTARVQPGATSGDLAGPAQAHGLALSTGDTHSVGMGGLTTGGGIGFMVRKHGLAIDNLLAAQVVTATGNIVTASAVENPDLFWGLRGGGGNFGIITEFTYRLAPVGQILGGELMLPANREVIRGYLDYVADAPEDLTTIANVMHAPPFPHVPPERVGELVLSILVCWTGSVADGERALAPLRALAAPVVDAVSPMPYPDIYKFTAHQAAPHGASIRSTFADQLSDDALDAVLDSMAHASSPFSLVQFRGLGGALARVANDATAFAHRDKRYFVAIIGLWLDASEDPAVHSAWTEALWRTIRPEGAGVYVNFLENEGADRVRDAYPPATFARLMEVKRKYDPRNLFRFNQNIPPQK